MTTTIERVEAFLRRLIADYKDLTQSPRAQALAADLEAILDHGGVMPSEPDTGASLPGPTAQILSAAALLEVPAHELIAWLKARV